MEGKVIKKIELELYFDENFVPPEKFDEPLSSNDWNSKCSACPFYGWEDDHASGWCGVDFGTIDAERVCPIKKYFEKNATADQRRKK